MSKAHRGRPLKKEGNNRGTCPITGLTGVKLLYEHENESGKKIKISKAAHGMLRNKKKLEERESRRVLAKSKAKEKPAESVEEVVESASAE